MKYYLNNGETINYANFQKLFNELYIPLCRYCAQFVNREEIAEDIVQEQFIHLWNKKDELHIQTSFKAYLYASVRNRSIDYLRNSYSKIKFVDQQAAVEETDFHNIADQIEEEELSAIITNALKELPERCAIIFSLKRYGEFSNKEIAEKLKISEKTVENQITIAFKKLRPVLSKYMKLLSILILS